MNHLVSTRVVVICPLKMVAFLLKLNFSDKTFDKRNKEVIDSFNNKSWLGVNIEKLAVDLQKGMLISVLW